MAGVSEPDPVGIDPEEDSEGWDDVEEDAEEVNIKCLYCEEQFHDIKNVVDHCKSNHSLDLIGLRKQHGLDFYSLIKLVNYIRSEVSKGNNSPNVSDPSKWDDNTFLQPVLENDALLFSLDDLEQMSNATQGNDMTNSSQRESDQNKSEADQSKIATLEAQLAKLQSQFDAYRETVTKTLDDRWAADDPEPKEAGPSRESRRDDSYFESYSYNDIHQTMLQDAVRTDAYRDFVYDNKHLFKDKVVLDVGCGTGILSLFCAKAGARQVLAVDNSAIIDKARQIAFENGVQDRITFLKTKVEDIQDLPGDIKEVDIIISEWMGYCLFFEAMLPSVLHARDRFLKRSADGSTFEGLMVPSHCDIHLAPLADPNWTADNVAFWSDVYGFNMECMLEGACTDVVVRHPPASTVCGRTDGERELKLWNLYETQLQDLQFSTDFKATLKDDIDALDAWCIWFDMGFSPKPPASSKSSVGSVAEIAKQPGGVAFSTGPLTKYTHWQCGMCVIERKGSTAQSLKAGSTIAGTLRYAKGDDSRALDVEIVWKGDTGNEETGRQLWKMG